MTKFIITIIIVLVCVCGLRWYWVVRPSGELIIPPLEITISPTKETP